MPTYKVWCHVEEYPDDDLRDDPQDLGLPEQLGEFDTETEALLFVLELQNAIDIVAGEK